MRGRLLQGRLDGLTVLGEVEGYGAASQGAKSGEAAPKPGGGPQPCGLNVFIRTSSLIEDCPATFRTNTLMG